MNSRPVLNIRYFLLTAIGLWSLAAGLSFWGVTWQSRNSIRQMAINQAVLSFEKDLVYRRWAAMHGGVYVPLTKETPANPYLQHIPERDITTPSGRKLTLMNPAYMTRQVFEIGRDDYGFKGHITSLQPLRPENLPDPWEKSVLQRFQQQQVNEITSVEELQDQPHLRYMRAMITEQGCLKCHARQGYKLGDIRGGISVSIPLAPFLAHQHTQFITIAIGHGLIWLVGIGFILLMTRRLRAGLQREEDSSRQLAAFQLQMFQQEKLASIGQLSAGVAHEINNPMGFITSNLATLHKYLDRIVSYTAVMTETLEQCTTSEQRVSLEQNRKKLKIDRILDDSVQLIHESLEGAERVKNIVADLKSFARTDQNLMKPLEINHCITTALNLVRNEYKYCAELKLDLQEELPQINGNSQQLVQVISNLVVNAAHALDANHGEITVSSWHDDARVCFAVHDNGCGISEELHHRIFEPFFTTKEVGKGTGLGLSISYDIIKKHGGEITVESEAGHGTTFTVRLPVESENIDTEKGE